MSGQILPSDPETDGGKGAEEVTRRYSLAIEGDEAGGYSAHVPELPAILVTGKSLDDLTARAAEAIQVYWEEIAAERSPTSVVREIEVTSPA
jgi:predicted RNase H-like HicB family nuclease